MNPALLGQLCDDLGQSERERERNEWVTDTVNVALSLGLFTANRTGALSSGSSAEGIERSVLSSDIDSMSVSMNSVVIQNPNVREWAHIDIVLQTLPTTHPCFVVLKLLKASHWKIWDFPLREIVKRVRDCWILPSERMALVDLARHEQGESYERHGPAMNMIVQGLEVDMINALRCAYWPDAAMTFLRYDGLYSEYHWPAMEDRQRIVRTGCHLVPKGNTLSEFHEYEWRYSFSQAEKMLIRMFNITQFRCYFLMKMLLNFVIKPRSHKAMCSYHIKTIMLHLAASAAPGVWVPANLHVCLQLCLNKLLEFVQHNCCPHFFVPQNNLFDSDEFRESREDLLTCVLALCREGFTSVLQCVPLHMDARFGCGHIEPRCQCFVRECLSSRLNLHLCAYMNGLTHILMSYYGVLHDMEREAGPCGVLVRLREIIRSVDENDVVVFPNRSQIRMVKDLLRSHMGYLSLVFTAQTRARCLPDAAVVRLFRAGCRVDVFAGKLKLACFLFMRGRTDLCIHLVYSVLSLYDRNAFPFAADKSRNELIYSNPRIKKISTRAKYTGNIKAMLKQVAFPVVFLKQELDFAPREIRALSEKPVLTTFDNFFNGLVFIDAIVFALFMLIKCFEEQGNMRTRNRVLAKFREVAQSPVDWELLYADSAHVLLDKLRQGF